MKAKLLLATSLIALSGCNSKGQQKTKNEGTISVKSSYSSSAGEVIQKVEEKTYPGLHAGDIAPDVIKIEGDYISEVVNGACIVQKGNSQALIDLKGNLILPWDDVKMTSSSPLCALINVKKGAYGGFVNVKGQYVTKSNYTGDSKYDSRKIAGVSDINKQISIDSKGTVLPYKTGRGAFDLYERDLTKKPGTALSPYYKDQSWGYITVDGREAIPAHYEACTQFTDGMAAVMKTDQFGTKKWGFVNPSGKLVIPYTYQIQPGPFHDGLALVRPAEKSDFSFAYIDQTGKIKFTIGDGNDVYANVSSRRKQSDGFFINGYSFWNLGFNGAVDYKILNTSGQFIKLESFMKEPPVPALKDGVNIYAYDELGIYYNAGGFLSNTRGLVDYNGNTIFPAAFGSIQPDYFSPYAIAMITKKQGARPNDSSSGNIFGVVNRQGVFVMILADKPKF